MSPLMLARLAELWGRTLVEHQPVNGRCPRCRTRGRCWEWANAFGQLVAYDMVPSTGWQPAHHTQS
ncbi:hypothetical protein [Micromonospora lupini]|uniref:Uncharacterized protein n=1 Tax=Micromonospora lupini str. Lupac 08 TaxID=1150864 RepID=I0L3P6_9ACTN|nr:hypothetical protein [Micromonospora lupini]CCH18443.1 hypothetical protein MILUP08_43353 [Micromonospora lupini str. Lupac 08]